MTKLENNGHDRRETDLLEMVEQELGRRVQAASELPWLEVGVTAEIDARERARQWLSSHGSLFSTSDQRGLKGSVAGLKQQIGALTGVLGSVRIWATIGAVVGGATVGYLLSGSYPGPAFMPEYSLPVTLSVAGALIAGMASQWPYLREFYS
ncbi:hypothetical protein JW859_13085 [bacterium]|nr:hypothetical protein [bacterium]